MVRDKPTLGDKTVKEYAMGGQHVRVTLRRHEDFVLIPISITVSVHRRDWSSDAQVRSQIRVYGGRRPFGPNFLLLEIRLKHHHFVHHRISQPHRPKFFIDPSIPSTVPLPHITTLEPFLT
jgi:hypothetical protein